MKSRDWLDTIIARAVMYPDDGWFRYGRGATLFLLFWAREAFGKDINVRAMALAYQLLFSLVPAVAVAASIFASLPAMSGNPDEFLSVVLGTVLLPGQRDVIVTHISRFAENAGTVGAIGGLLLLFFTVTMARTVDNAFNALWEVRRRRPLMQSWSGMALLLVLGTAVVALWLHGLGPWVANELRGGQGMPLLGGFALSFGVFLMMYRLVPYTQVSWWPAVAGAMVAAVAWSVARDLFATYVVRIVSYGRIYGSLGALPLLLLWLYVSWLVTLLGCVATRVLQDYRVLEDNERHLLAGERNRVFWALVILREIGCAFEHRAADAPSLDVMARAASQPTAFFEEIAERLVQHGVLVPWDGRQGQYVLARDPTLLPLQTVLRAVERDPFQVPDHRPQMGDDPVRNRVAQSAEIAMQLLTVAGNATVQALRGATVRELLNYSVSEDSTTPDSPEAIVSGKLST